MIYSSISRPSFFCQKVGISSHQTSILPTIKQPREPHIKQHSITYINLPLLYYYYYYFNMRFSIAAAGLATMVSTALAGNAIVKNNCAEDVYLTITRSDQSSTQYALAADSGTYSETLTGQGNSFGVTKSADYYSASTPKLIWGFSDSASTVYYSVSSVDGNPFSGESFSLSATNTACGTVTAYDGLTYTCADSNDFTLALCT